MFPQAESRTGVGFLCHIDVGLTSDVHWVANVYYVLGLFFLHILHIVAVMNLNEHCCSKGETAGNNIGKLRRSNGG